MPPTPPQEFLEQESAYYSLLPYVYRWQSSQYKRLNELGDYEDQA